jgi:probable HAF family extracellular repeat protein
VNDGGWVVGVSLTAAGDQHAFLWTRDAGMQDITAAGWSFARAEAVSDNGVVVGWGMRNGEIEGFVWRAADGMTSIGIPSTYTASQCLGVAETGEVVGTVSTATGGWSAIVWNSPSSYQVLGSLGGGFSLSLDINNEGRVAGTSALGNSDERAVLWRPGASVEDLGTLGGDWSGAYGINESSQVVGWAEDAGYRVRPFIWPEAGSMADLGTLGGDEGEAYEVSDGGNVVGESEDAAGNMRPTLWTADGQIIDLGTLGGASGHARDINATGSIVGYSMPATGERHATLWANGDGGGNGGGGTVPELLEDLGSAIDDMIAAGSFRGRQYRSLLSKVRVAERMVERDRPRVAIRSLRVLIWQVNLYVRFGRVTEDEAQPVIDLAQETIQALLDGEG